MQPIGITRYTMVSALGNGLGATLDALHNDRGGLRPCDFADADIETWIGRVDGVEEVSVPDDLQAYACRNNRLALMGLRADAFSEAVAAAVERHGASRVGVFVGTSTSGIRETELAYAGRDVDGRLPQAFRYRETHNTFSPADFVRRALGLRGPAQAVSTACSSGIKAFASARRHMRAGLCDAAVVGGVDSLCLTTLYGFRSLEVVAPAPCRPWDRNRNGISIGEAAAFALLDTQATDLALLGFGESVDAHHMSAPHPEGLGAQIAMRGAIDSAGMTARDIDYVNLHGTATPANDAAEDHAITAVVGTRTPCSSTKGWTGHTLGAAGSCGVVLGCLGIEHGFLPGSLNTEERDATLRANIVLRTTPAAPRNALVNAFGFGGNNCAVIVGRPL